MVSAVDICNRALDAIAAENITSLDDQNQAGGLCKRLFPQIRDEVLRNHPWNCAMRRAALTASVDVPAWGYALSYPLPADCLRVFEVEGTDSDYYPWRVESGSIVTDLGAPLYIRYVRRVDDTGLLDPMLVTAMAARMAWALAMPITQSATMRDAMQKDYVASLRAARSADGQEGIAQIVGADDFILARL